MTEVSISENQFAKQPLPLPSIIFAQQAVLLPLYFFIPLWVAGLNIVAAALVLWRVRTQRFVIKPWLKVLITLVAIGGILYVFRKFSGRDAGVALIAAMYGLKILEVNSRRDANLLLSVGFFILVSGFLFSQKPWIALYQVVPVLALLNAFIALNSLPSNAAKKQPATWVFRSVGKYLALALPLMVFLFLFFPRLGGPLWRMPGGSTATSGVSDSMSPGQISSLQLFDKVAFRASFNGEAPQPQALYWRMLSLDEFDGLTWTRAGVGPLQLDEVAPEITQYEYKVTMEPSRQNFLVSLDRPIKSPDATRLLTDFSVYSRYRILDRTRYTLTSAPSLSIGLGLTSTRKQFYTQLPQSGNPRTRAWAKALRAESADDSSFVQQVLQTINRQEFYYTLQPPILEQDIVDSFWLDYRRGFCEHYASALVYIARAAGIPARVVVGYQGGEKNPLSDYWIVKYANAHAWTELWYEGQGWVRIDPTAAIATERVEAQLLSDYAQRESLFDDYDLVELGDLGWLKQTEYWFDQLNSNWNDWILDFNSQRQNQLFSNIGFSGITSQQLIILMVVGLTLFVVIVSGRQLYSPKQPPLQRAFQRLIERLVKHGTLDRASNIGPSRLREILLSANRPELEPVAQWLTDYIVLQYTDTKVTQEAELQMSRRINKLSRRLGRYN